MQYDVCKSLHLEMEKMNPGGRDQLSRTKGVSDRVQESEAGRVWKSEDTQLRQHVTWGAVPSAFHTVVSEPNPDLLSVSPQKSLGQFPLWTTALLIQNSQHDSICGQSLSDAKEAL